MTNGLDTPRQYAISDGTKVLVLGTHAGHPSTCWRLLHETYKRGAYIRKNSPCYMNRKVFTRTFRSLGWKAKAIKS